MTKILRRLLIFLLLVSILSTCIDPYSPKLKGYESLLVVDALITNENRTYSVELSRTMETQDIEPFMVSGATVIIRDENGTSSILRETAEGIYKTDSLLFQGKTGYSYILYIQTPEGTEYESEPCFMYPVQPIDSIYYSKDQEILNNGSEALEGIRIYVDSESSDVSKQHRWVYDEWWKIVVPNPKKYNYINDTTFSEVDPVKHICWGNNKSDEIIIHSASFNQTERIEKKPILFLATDQTNRLVIQYSILIKQLSLSKMEYQFWDNMRQINESGGNIFEKQPFPVVSNIHNINNSGELILGYFQVSSVEQKRIYITCDDISDLNLPVYNYDCATIILGPDDFPPSLFPGGGMSFAKLYKLYNGPVYSFIEPVYNDEGKLKKYMFAKKACADCTLSGSLAKPDFWVDL